MSRPERDLRHSVIFIALAVTVLRLIAAGTIHLTEDEAYYRLWAQHLQFGYFDHPPMVAWWIHLGERIAGDASLGVRLLPTLATGLTTWLVGDLTLRLGARQEAAARAALWYNATLTIGTGGLLATPDVPASFFWALTLWCLARAWASGRDRWWLGAGAAAGLSVLSKYSGLFLAPGVILWLVLIPGGLNALKRPGPWAAALIAVLLFSVNIVWNAEHHWVSFVKQFGRAAPNGLHPGHLVEFLGVQFLLLNPLIAIFAVRGFGQGWRTRATPGAPHLMLPIATSVPFAAYLMLHSLHDRVQGHWPAPLFGALAICAAVAAEPLTEGRLGRLARRAAPVLGFAISAIVLTYIALPTSRSLGGFDPASALRGWPAFATQVEQLRASRGDAWVGSQSYGVMAQLDLQHTIKAPVLQIVERDRYRNDGRPRPDFSRPGLLVDLERRLHPANLSRCFEVVTPVAIIDRGQNAGHNGRYAAFEVSRPRRDVWSQGCPGEVSRSVGGLPG